MKRLATVGLLVLLVAVPAVVVFGQDNPDEGRPPPPPRRMRGGPDGEGPGRGPLAPPRGMRDRPDGEGPRGGPPPPPPIPPEKREQLEPAVQGFMEALGRFHRAAMEVLGPRDGTRFTMHIVGRFMEAHRPKPPEGEKPDGPPPEGEGARRPRPPRGEGERGPRPPRRGDRNL